MRIDSIHRDHIRNKVLSIRNRCEVLAYVLSHDWTEPWVHTLLEDNLVDAQNLVHDYCEHCEKENHGKQEEDTAAITD